jgi:hypothetical protein
MNRRCHLRFRWLFVYIRAIAASKLAMSKPKRRG